jgi:hypothetical protein
MIGPRVTASCPLVLPAEEPGTAATTLKTTAGPWTAAARPSATSSYLSPTRRSSAPQFDRAQRILGRCSAQIGQRAANPSGYTLTGLFRSPECGRGYIRFAESDAAYGSRTQI